MSTGHLRGRKKSHLHRSHCRPGGLQIKILFLITQFQFHQRNKMQNNSSFQIKYPVYVFRRLMTQVKVKPTTTPTNLLNKFFYWIALLKTKTRKNPNQNTVFRTILLHAKHGLRGKKSSDYSAIAREALVSQQQFQFLSSLFAFKTKIFFQACLCFHTIKPIPK